MPEDLVLPTPTSKKLAEYPAQFPKDKFRSVVMAAGLVWQSYKTIPTAELIQHNVLRSFTLKEIRDIQSTEEFASEMTRKGIAWTNFSPLSDRQIAALEALSDPLQGGTPEQKLKRLGITTREYNMWKRDKLFSTHLRLLAEETLSSFDGEIGTALVNKALGGNLEHIKYLNEITGRYNPAAEQAREINSVIQDILEIIARHVTDTEALDRIGFEIIGLIERPKTLREQIVDAYHDNG